MADVLAHTKRQNRHNRVLTLLQKPGSPYTIPTARPPITFSDGLHTMQEINELIQTETPAIVGETLDFMLYECSLDEAPEAEDVARWRDILRARGGKFLRLADLCQTWLDGEGA